MRKRDLTHAMHFVEDIVRVATLRFEHPGALFKFLALVKLGGRVGARTFVETGTFLGDTARRAAGRFERVITIELDPKLAREAKARLARFDNIEVIEGDGTAVLPQVMARSDVRDALVFLDGHTSGGVTACGDVPEPCCLELDALRPFADKIAGIVIDDFRCFGSEPGFPSKLALISAVDSFCGDKFEYSVAFDQVLIKRRVAH